MSDTTPDQAAVAGRGWRKAVGFFFLSFGYIGLRFILTPIQIRVLTSVMTKEQYGAMTLIIMTVTFAAVILSMGHFEFIVRKLPGRTAAYQYGLLRLVTRFFGLVSVLAGAAGIGAFLFLSPAKLELGLTELVAAGLALVLVVYILQRVFFMLARAEWLRVRTAQLLYSDTWFVAVLVLAAIGELRLGLIVWAWTLWILAAAILVSRWVRHAPPAPPPVPIREVLAFGVPLLPWLTGEWLFRIGDRYVLLAARNVEAMANYSLCMNVALIVYVVGSSVLDLLIPEFNRECNRVPGRHPGELAAVPRLQSLVTLMLRYSLLLSIGGALFLVLCGPQILAVLSAPKFHNAAFILPLLAPVPLLFLLWSVFNRILLSMDRSRVIGGLTLAAALFNLGLNLILVSRFHERGAALSMVISLACLALVTGWTVRVWRWVQWRELALGRLAALSVLGLAGVGTACWVFGSRALLCLGVSALWCLALVGLLGLIRKEDFSRISLVPTPAEIEGQEP